MPLTRERSVDQGWPRPRLADLEVKLLIFHLAGQGGPSRGVCVRESGWWGWGQELVWVEEG